MRILALVILAIATVSATPSARAQTYNPNYPVAFRSSKCSAANISMRYTRWHSAPRPQRVSPPSASSTRFTRAQQRRREDATGGIAAAIELVRRPEAILGAAKAETEALPGPPTSAWLNAVRRICFVFRVLLAEFESLRARQQQRDHYDALPHQVLVKNPKFGRCATRIIGVDIGGGAARILAILRFGCGLA
jgi:hypothetical protein